MSFSPDSRIRCFWLLLLARGEKRELKLKKIDMKSQIFLISGSREKKTQPQ